MDKTIFDTSLPEYVIGKYNSFFLLRFFPEEQYRDYFLDGKLYMRQHTEFSKEELGKGRYDITEGADIVAIQRNQDSFIDIQFLQKNGQGYVQIIENVERPENYRDNQMFIYYPVENQKRNIFCLVTLWCNENNIACLNEDKMKCLGEFGVFIARPVEFIHRIATAAERDESIKQVRCGFVNYITEDQMTNVMDINPFLKPAKDYFYQNEFRVCADTDNTELLELSLERDIRDIAIPIRLHDFLKTARYQNGTLIFKREK